MPAKFRIKEYYSDGYYHVYNRGVEKRAIFIDEQDYRVYLSYLETYLMPKNRYNLQEILADPNTSRQEKNKTIKLLRLNNFSESISLLSFCLMPNHFHLLIHQTASMAIDQFMNSISTRYSGYFNRKYHRIGTLFQGVYKAVVIKSDEQLLYLTRYIHRNPLSLKLSELNIRKGYTNNQLQQYIYSSYPTYVGVNHLEWVKPTIVLSEFNQVHHKNTYKSFVETPEHNEKENTHLEGITIEEQ